MIVTEFRPQNWVCAVKARSTTPAFNWLDDTLGTLRAPPAALRSYPDPTSSTSVCCLSYAPGWIGPFSFAEFFLARFFVALRDAIRAMNPIPRVVVGLLLATVLAGCVTALSQRGSMVRVVNTRDEVKGYKFLGTVTGSS